MRGGPQGPSQDARRQFPLRPSLNAQLERCVQAGRLERNGPDEVCRSEPAREERRGQKVGVGVRWTREEYERYLARSNGARASIVKTAASRSAPSSAEPEPIVRNESVGTAPREACYSMRVRVCVTSFRVRLLDPDNLCPKYFVDCLRYSNCIRDDRSQDIALEIRQEKVASKSDERTEIELTPL